MSTEQEKPAGAQGEKFEKADLDELIHDLKNAGISWNDDDGTEVDGEPLRLWDDEGEPLYEHPWIQGQCLMRKEAARIAETYRNRLREAGR